jgi:HSP20 family molecular chaperone IbpA
MSTLPEIIINTLNSIDGSNIFSQILHQQGLNPELFWKPPVDIINEESNIIVYVDIPGISTDDLYIDFLNNKIEISGERIKPYNKHINKEIVYGNFNRKIILPINVTNSNSVNVTAKNGVLKIVINKELEEKNKFSVSVNSNS